MAGTFDSVITLSGGCVYKSWTDRGAQMNGGGGGGQPS